MQLTPASRLRDALAVATCSLLAVEPTQAGFFDFDTPWKFDAAVLFYSETDRVEIIEPVLQAKKEIGEGEFVTLKLIYDSMSGATPNGATPAATSQTFTSPSGETKYTAAPHQLPLVAFSDTRAAINVEWERPITPTLRNQFSFNISSETDYSSLGMSASLLQDLNNKLTTLLFGAAVNADWISPSGGAPQELSTLTPLMAIAAKEIEAEAEGGEGEEGGGALGEFKSGYDLMVGVTHVLSRRVLMQLNLGHGVAKGYLTDPYKIVSVIDGTTGENVTLGGNLQYLYEKRPDTRARNTLYWKTVLHLPEDVVNVAYRYYWDDWDVISHTLDLTYHLEISSKIYLEPHYRYYTQTAAKFYGHGVVAGNIPSYASSDLRLAELRSTTAGLRFAQNFSKTSAWGLSLDIMRQTGNAHPRDAIGVQKTEALFTDLEALSVMADFKLEF